MSLRFVIALVFFTAVAAFNMKPVTKWMAGAAAACSMAPVMPALADGAVSASSVYRARNYYGAKIVDLQSAVEKGDFNTLADKKVVNAFDLFISGTNKQPNAAIKERKAAELKLEKDFFAAIKAKDSGKAKATYSEFIKVADLKPDFKKGELGQTDSSGYSPTWGTDRQYIYQR